MDYAHLERAGRVTQTLTPRPLEMRKVINDRIASKWRNSSSPIESERDEDIIICVCVSLGTFFLSSDASFA